MVGRRIGDKPLSEPMLTWFTDAYMQHKGEMSFDGHSTTAWANVSSTESKYFWWTYLYIYIYICICIYIHLYIIRYILTPSLCNSPRKISWTIQSYQNFCLNKLFNVVLFRLYIYGWYWCFRNCVIMSRGEYKCCKWYKISKKRLFISLFVLSGETNFWNWPLWQRRKR